MVDEEIIVNSWDEQKIRRLIDEGVEESLGLEYKSAGAFGRQNNKKKEITKDVSSMANSSGGIIIYGVKEFDDPEKRHLPEKIDPISSTEFSKEWLEQIVSNIQPRIDDIVIHPIRLNGSENLACYVVEISEGKTAYQAQDHKYYRRYNFEAVPMVDYEIRLLMNRLTYSDVSVEFGYNVISRTRDLHEYQLSITVINNGQIITRFFMLEIIIPGIVLGKSRGVVNHDHILQSQNHEDDIVIHYRSQNVLFPSEERSITQEVNFTYKINSDVFHKLREKNRQGEKHYLSWKLYADEMPYKSGQILFSDLHGY